MCLLLGRLEIWMTSIWYIVSSRNGGGVTIVKEARMAGTDSVKHRIEK